MPRTVSSSLPVLSSLILTTTCWCKCRGFPHLELRHWVIAHSDWAHKRQLWPQSSSSESLYYLLGMNSVDRDPSRFSFGGGWGNLEHEKRVDVAVLGPPLSCCTVYLYTLFFIHYIQLHGSIIIHGEGNGNPLQYSCLENLMDGEAW